MTFIVLAPEACIRLFTEQFGNYMLLIQGHGVCMESVLVRMIINKTNFFVTCYATLFNGDKFWWQRLRHKLRLTKRWLTMLTIRFFCRNNLYHHRFLCISRGSRWCRHVPLCQWHRRCKLDCCRILCWDRHNFPRRVVAVADIGIGIVDGFDRAADTALSRLQLIQGKFQKSSDSFLTFFLRLPKNF